MESGNPQLTTIDGIDLSNYIRDPNSYNPVVYIHKRNLKRCIPDDEDKESPQMLNKGQQFNFDDENKDTYKVNIMDEDNQNAIAERTINFAKTLIPITIPPKINDENVYYTIKSTKKSRTENRGCRCNLDNSNYETLQKNKKEKVKSKKNISKSKQCFKTSETITQSSANTIQNSDDTHNQSLSELSIFSDNKLKESPTRSKPDNTKFIPSQSFIALAEEYQDVGKIKIQMMNDEERKTLYESISIPLVSAVKESISADEFNKSLVAVKNKIDKFSDKLNDVLERLNRIEEKLSNRMVNNRMTTENIQANTSSKEEGTVERDGVEESDRSSIIRERRSVKKRQDRDDISIQSIEGRGKRVPESCSSSLFVGVAPTPVHRLPARFCWTDTKLN